MIFNRNKKAPTTKLEQIISWVYPRYRIMSYNPILPGGGGQHKVVVSKVPPRIWYDRNAKREFWVKRLNPQLGQINIAFGKYRAEIQLKPPYVK